MKDRTTPYETKAGSEARFLGIIGIVTLLSVAFTLWGIEAFGLPEPFKRLAEHQRTMQNTTALTQKQSNALNDYLLSRGVKVGGSDVVVEFSDAQCPYCRQQEAAVTKIKNSGIATFVHVEMPLPMHPLAGPAALADIAAEGEGKGWQYHSAIYSASDLTRQGLVSEAMKIGLNRQTFAADMNSLATRIRLKHDLALADELGVEATPTYILMTRDGQVSVVNSVDAVALAL